VHQLRMAQLAVLGAFVVFVRSATVRMSQMIDWDEPWHGPIDYDTDLAAQYPVVNVLAALNGVFLLLGAAAVAPEHGQQRAVAHANRRARRDCWSSRSTSARVSGPTGNERPLLAGD